MAYDWRSRWLESKANSGNRPLRECKVCKEKKKLLAENFMRNKIKKGSAGPVGFMTVCRQCIERMNNARADNPKLRIYMSAKARAKQKDIPFDLKPSDLILPTHCPYLGVELDYSIGCIVNGVRRPNGASIDKIIPALGYVRGNVQIISDLANRMKNNATIDQLVQFARGVLRKHSQSEEK